MNLLTQPFAQGSEVSRGDVFLQVRKFFPDLMTYLRPIEISEQIGGDVSESAQRPVDVLKDTLSRVRRYHLQILLHAGIPGFLQVLDFQFPFDHLLF